MSTETAPQTAGSRNKILARIREALQLSAPERHLGHHGGAPASPPATAQTKSREQWLPDVPDSFEGRVELFQKNSELLKTRFVRCASAGDARSELLQIAEQERWQRIATHQNPLVDAILGGWNFCPAIVTDHGCDPMQMESVSAGISACESIIAQTGSILISAESSGGRALSVLPPHHVVIVEKRQLVRDLEEAFSELRKGHGGKLPLYFSFITGPSRTGDIERILVLGAHGPKQLTVLFVEN